MGIVSQSRSQNLKVLNELGRRGLADSKQCRSRMCNQSADLQSAVWSGTNGEQATTFLQGLQGKRQEGYWYVCVPRGWAAEPRSSALLPV